MVTPVRLIASAFVLALISAVPGSALAASGHPASPAAATLTIKGIDRDGTPVSVQASVIGLNGTSYLSGGSSVKLPPGTYEVAAPIWRTADNGSQSLVAESVHMTGTSKTVTLNAQGAIPISATLTASGVTQGSATASLCTGGNTLTGLLVDSPATIYVKPIKNKHLQMVYQTYWQGTGSIYEVAGSDSDGIPASPSYSGTPGSMAKVNMQIRANEDVTPLQSVIASYATCGSIDLPENLLPDTYTDYRTPGNWNVNLNFGPTVGQVQRDTWTDRTYKSGKTYSDVYASAGTGPGPQFPLAQGSSIAFDPGNMFSDPLVRAGFDCEGKATVVLKHSGTQLKSQKITFCAKHTVFSAHAGHAGWYNLTVTATRYNPSGTVPAGTLSSSIVQAWHFRYAPVHGHAINVEAMPVTVAKFEPEGLGSANDALGSTTTTVKLLIARGGGEPVSTPKYALKPVKVLMSVDDGLTWTAVSVTKSGKYWLAKVPNPLSGYVSLRAVVADVKGNSTTETIIRAYEVQNPD